MRHTWAIRFLALALAGIPLRTEASEASECPGDACSEGTNENELACVSSGGSVSTASCCLTASNFPNTCLIGACGCSPENSHEISVCNCPDGTCFDGTGCVPLIDEEQACENSGGSVTTASCCLSVDDFPDTCVTGACGCSPENSHEIRVCKCPDGTCFDGTGCVPLIDEKELACINSGGLVSTASCCLSVDDFPDTCVIGGCGCSPNNSHDVSVCDCPHGGCFNGNVCVPFLGAVPGFVYIQGDGREGCIAPRGTRDGSRLFLGDCGSQDQMWRIDDEGRFHSYLDEEVCMQAGRGRSIGDGSKLRVYECDEKQDLQVFSWDDVISPVANLDLCVVSHGVHQDINEDDILLKLCDSIDDDRLGWVAV